jgi:hypothetical protein
MRIGQTRIEKIENNRPGRSRGSPAPDWLESIEIFEGKAW